VLLIPSSAPISPLLVYTDPLVSGNHAVIDSGELVDEKSTNGELSDEDKEEGRRRRTEDGEQARLSMI